MPLGFSLTLWRAVCRRPWWMARPIPNAVRRRPLWRRGRATTWMKKQQSSAALPPNLTSMNWKPNEPSLGAQSSSRRHGELRPAAAIPVGVVVLCQGEGAVGENLVTAHQEFRARTHLAPWSSGVVFVTRRKTPIINHLPRPSLQAR